MLKVFFGKRVLLPLWCIKIGVNIIIVKFENLINRFFEFLFLFRYISLIFKSIDRYTSWTLKNVVL